MRGEILFNASNYPSMLKQIPDAPHSLYYKGNYHTSIFENCLAVVGSRRMTTYGKLVTQNLVGELAQSGITIVSGFMYGIDATAHKAALKVGGKTIAVMPCGIDTINPYYQLSLYEQIIDSGLILSEYPGSFQPQLWTYPKRNRIVAGLCKAILVVEAANNSGSLITADFGKSFGKELFSVPGPINSENSQGTLSLIKKGAQMVTSASEILSFFNVVYGLPLFNKLYETSDDVMDALYKEPMNLDELCNFLDMPVTEISSRLTQLLIEGRILQEGSKFYAN